MIPDANDETVSMPPLVLSPLQIASWSLPRLRPANIEYAVAGIPSLQRGLVWNASKIELLWELFTTRIPHRLVCNLQAARAAVYSR